MTRKFWSIYCIVSIVVLSVVYIAGGNTTSATISLTDAKLSAIYGAWHTKNDQRCIRVGGCSTTFCIPQNTHNYDTVGNDNYDECRNQTGNHCREEDQPYSSWYCKFKKYDNTCNNPGEWTWDPLPDCTN